MGEKLQVTREMIKKLLKAHLEKQYAAKELLEEMSYLLEEYFIGKFNMIGEELRVELLNGQKFMISIREERN